MFDLFIVLPLLKYSLWFFFVILGHVHERMRLLESSHKNSEVCIGLVEDRFRNFEDDVHHLQGDVWNENFITLQSKNKIEKTQECLQ